MKYKNIKDIDVIATAQSIESDYGMDPKKWPENDPRLRELHEWYLNHSEEKRETCHTQKFEKFKKHLMNKCQRKQYVRYLKLVVES